MTPEQAKSTLSTLSASISWKPGEGQRLRAEYWKRRALHRCRGRLVGGLMRDLHARGRLHGFKVRRSLAYYASQRAALDYLRDDKAAANSNLELLKRLRVFGARAAIEVR